MMELVYLTYLFLLMAFSAAQKQPEWICRFNGTHRCMDGNRWIPKQETIDGLTNKTNGYVLADINNGSSTSEETAILDVNHEFLSNRGTIRITYRSETAEPREREGTLNIIACKSQAEPVFSAGHSNCSDWCTSYITYTCENRRDVEVVFTAMRGSENTNIAIDYISITPTPDWEFTFRDGYNESVIEQSDTDSRDWNTIGTGNTASFRAVLNRNSGKEGYTAVFSVKHQFTSPSGEMWIGYYFASVSGDGFLNVSTCTNNDTVLSIPPSNDNYLYHSSLNYECESAEDVFMTFTAVRGVNMTLIDIYTIRIFEDPSDTTADRSTTLTPASTIPGVLNIGSATATRTTTTTATEAATPNVQKNNDSTPSRLIVLIVAVVTTIILLVLLIIAVVGCTLRYRRRKAVNSSPNLFKPRSSSQNVYMNPAFLPGPNTSNEGNQPDLLNGLNAPLTAESQEAHNFQTAIERSENASSGYTEIGTTSHDENGYCSVDGSPSGAGGDDPDSRSYSLPDGIHYDPTNPYSRPGVGGKNGTTGDDDDDDGDDDDDDDARAGYQLLKKSSDNSPPGRDFLTKTGGDVRDSIINHDYYSLKDDKANDYDLIESAQNQDSEVLPECAVSNNGEYAQLGTTDTAVLYDDEHYNHLVHKDHHNLQDDRTRSGNHGNKEDRSSNQTNGLYPSGLFNGNVYNTFNGNHAESRDDGGDYENPDAIRAKEAVSHPLKTTALGKVDGTTENGIMNPTSQGIPKGSSGYESLNFKQDEHVCDGLPKPNYSEGSLEDPYEEPLQPNITDGPNETYKGNVNGGPKIGEDQVDQDGHVSSGLPALNDSEDSLEDPYEEPFQPNITDVPDETYKGNVDGGPKTGVDQVKQPSKDVRDQVNAARSPVTGDYQSLKFGKVGMKNNKDGVGHDGNVDQGLGNEAIGKVSAPENAASKLIHIDRDIDAYGPKTNSFNRISPLYHSIKIEKK